MLCVQIQVQGVSERSELAPCKNYRLNLMILLMILPRAILSHNIE